MSLASSCNIERGFSCGGLTVSKLCCALLDESMCAATALHAWSEFLELVPAADIIQTFKDKPWQVCNQKNTSTEGPSNAMDIDSDNIVEIVTQLVETELQFLFKL